MLARAGPDITITQAKQRKIAVNAVNKRPFGEHRNSTDVSQRILLDKTSSDTCIVCKTTLGPKGNLKLLDCHGTITGVGELKDVQGKQVFVKEAIKRCCLNKFHKECLMGYTAGDFNLQYAARPECQNALLCPAHACETCNLKNLKQSAYDGDVFQCKHYLNGYHEGCKPASAEFVFEQRFIGKQRVTLKVINCFNHHAANELTDELPEKDHVKLCSLKCVEPEGEDVIHCKRCIRSFHSTCSNIDTVEGEEKPDDVCDFCLQQTKIPVATFVVYRRNNRFAVAKTTAWDELPAQHQRVVNPSYIPLTLSSNPRSELSWPSHLVAILTEKLIGLFPKKVQTDFISAFRAHERILRSRVPSVSKQVNKYITKNVYTQAAKKERLEVVEMDMCEPTCDCSGEGCPYWMDERECPEECQTRRTNNIRCRNRASTEINHNALNMGNTDGKGNGLFANLNIDSKAAPLLIEYVGEVVVNKERDERMSIIEKSGDHQPNLYMMNMKNGKTAIDATQMGNNARYANHSCDPNLVAVEIKCFVVDHVPITRANRNASPLPVAIGKPKRNPPRKRKNPHQWQPTVKRLYETRIFFVPIKDIRQNEEVTISYGFERKDYVPICQCGVAAVCDGVMSKKPASVLKALTAPPKPRVVKSKTKKAPAVKPAPATKKNTGPLKRMADNFKTNAAPLKKPRRR